MSSLFIVPLELKIKCEHVRIDRAKILKSWLELESVEERPSASAIKMLRGLPLYNIGLPLASLVMTLVDIQMPLVQAFYVSPTSNPFLCFEILGSKRTTCQFCSSQLLRWSRWDLVLFSKTVSLHLVLQTCQFPHLLHKVGGLCALDFDHPRVRFRASSE